MKSSSKAVLVLSALVMTSVTLPAQADQEAPVIQNFEAYGFQSAQEMEQYLSVSEVIITENEIETSKTKSEHFKTKAPVDPRVELGNETLDNLGSVIANPYSPKAWLSLGKKVWEIVVKNEPVLNASSKTVSVLPAAATNWSQMENWQSPVAKSYTITARNGYGIDAVSHTYTVTYNWGGQLNDHGAYLANATIIPTKISVAWGYTLNSSVEVGNILNTGTAENPIPGVTLNLKYNMATILKKSQGIDSFFVRGNGKLTHTTPN